MNAETHLKRAIVETLNGLGLARVQSTPSGRAKGGRIRLAAAGTPDITGYTPTGRYVGLEVKVPGSKHDPARLAVQRDQLSRIAKAGGIAGFVTSVQEAVDLLRGNGNGGKLQW